MELNKYEPKGLLALYQTQNGESYMEFSKVIMGKISAFVPCRVNTLKSLVKNLHAQTTSEENELLPNGIIYLNRIENALAWIMPAKKIYLNFTEGFLPSDKYNIPNTLFYVIGEEVKVFALKSSNIKEDTQLYRALFPNVGTDGTICFGSAKLNISECSTSVKIDRIKKAFFGSKFSHFSGQSEEDQKEFIESIGRKVNFKQLSKSSVKLTNLLKL